LFNGFGHSEPKIDVLSACYISTVDGKAVLSAFDHGNGAKPALTVLPFRFLTRGGCINRTQNALASAASQSHQIDGVNCRF